MPINATVTYSHWTGEADGVDVGIDVDRIPLIGAVRLVPAFMDHRPVLASDGGYTIPTFEGYLDTDGVLKSTRGGVVGLRYWANDPIFNLEELWYKVEFDLTTPIGDPVTVTGGWFEAPSTDTTIPLQQVLTSTGSTIMAVGRAYGLYLGDIIGSGTAGRAALAAETAADGRAAFGIDLLDLDEWDWYDNRAAFPVSGSTDRVYGARDTDAFYRWTGATYVQVNPARPHASIASLRAAAASVDGYVRVLGYYAAGDGGGGIFRWDSTDTTSTDNGGTIVTPSGGLASSGRWKRVYEGEVNARWFGVNPSQTDNTAALQKCVNWVSQAYPVIGGTVFIPMGWYEFLFDQGASGLSTITIAADNVLIRGEGRGSRLMVKSHAWPSQLAYFFTFSQSGRGQGGGVRDLNFYGNSMLKWCIYLSTWRDAAFENVSAFDVHAGILDAESTHASLLGEGIAVRHLDCAPSAGTSATQYGVRFRGGAAASTTIWSDCSVRDLDIISCWDSGLVLDNCQRFTVSNVTAANNNTISDTLDGTSKTGCLHAVRITNTVVKPWVTGDHVVDSIYLESGAGGETATANVAVLIEAMNVAAQIQWNRISNVTASPSTGLLRLIDNSGFGRLTNTTFTGNRVPATSTLVTVGAAVVNTFLNLTPAPGVPWSVAVTDAGTNTVINGADDHSLLHHDFSTKSNGTPSLTMDSGQTATMYTLSSTSGTPDAWTVLGGKLVMSAYGTTVATSDGVNHAVYMPVDLGAPVTRVKVPVTWPAASVGGSQFTIVLPSAAWTSSSLPAAGIHAAFSANGQWHVSRWNGSSEDTSYASDATYGRFTPQNTGVAGNFEFFIDRTASTLKIIFPDGKVVGPLYDSHIATETGNRVVFELFVSSVINDIPPAFGQFVADTQTSTFDSRQVTLGDVIPLITPLSKIAYTNTVTNITGGTVTLTSLSTPTQEFTGTGGTVVAPSTGVGNGWVWYIVNATSGNLTVNASGGGLMGVLATGETARIQAFAATPTAAGSWLTQIQITRDGTSTFRNKTISAALNTISLRANEVGEFWTPPGFTFASTNYYFFNSGAVAQAVQPTNNRLMFAWCVIPVAVTISKVFAEVTVAGAASSVVRLGLYNDDGTFNPGTLVADFGTIDGTSATVQEITVSQVIPAGGYWVASVAQSAGTVPTWRAIGTSGMPLPSMFTLGTTLPVAGAAIYGKAQASVTGTLPSPATATLASSGCARMGFKAT